MPTNRKMRDLIVANADLLVEAGFPQPVQDLCAHVTAVEIVTAAEEAKMWLAPLIPHPKDSYVSYVRRTFATLKLEQQQLLGLTSGAVVRSLRGLACRPCPPGCHRQAGDGTQGVASLSWVCPPVAGRAG